MLHNNSESQSCPTKDGWSVMRVQMTLAEVSAGTIPSVSGKSKRSRWRLWFGAVGATAALSVASIGPAHASDGVADVSAAEVEDALSGVSSALLEPAVDSSTTSTAAAVVDGEGGRVSVPRDPSDSVELTAGTTPVSIGLPEASDASAAVRSASGAITYPSGNGSASTVVPLVDGVQMLTTIASADAPQSFAYQVDIPQGGSVALNPDGTAVVSDAEGKPLITTSAPWAVDANGTAVPTHYEVDGTSLIQVIDHATGDFSYPIVADPTYWWGGKEWWSASRVNVSLASVGVAGYIGMTGPAIIVGSALLLCNQAGRGIWVYWTWAGQAWCTGP